MRTGPTNPNLRSLIEELRKKSYSDNVPLFRRVADDLEKPTRKRRAVNLSRINRFGKEGELIVVPGKVLASGELGRSVTIAAYRFSTQALEKIAKANAKAITLSQLLRDGLKWKNVRIIG